MGNFPMFVSVEFYTIFFAVGLWQIAREARRAENDRSPMLFGFRSAITMKSDAHWLAAHKAAAPVALTAARALLCQVPITVAVWFLVGPIEGTWLAIGAATATYLLAWVIGSRIANQAAGQVDANNAAQSDASAA